MGFCSDNPCQNEGKCFNVAESYECQCKEEFEGQNCERVKDYCAQPGASCEGKKTSVKILRADRIYFKFHKK